MDGWVYETTFTDGKPGIWMLGWDAVQPYPTDAKVPTTTIRHGNFDYLTNTVKWDPAIADRALPNSLYLTGKPAFFEAGRGYTWPWVDPAAPTNSTCCRPRRATTPERRSPSPESVDGGRGSRQANRTANHGFCRGSFGCFALWLSRQPANREHP